jgi:hypothetical protein
LPYPESTFPPEGTWPLLGAIPGDKAESSWKIFTKVKAAGEAIAPYSWVLAPFLAILAENLKKK